MRKKKLITIFLSFIIIICAAAIYICDRAIERATSGRLYSETETIPFNKVGLLLGTGKYLSGGSRNPYYVYRIEAAARLLKAGKIKYLVISGDNSRKDYSEPEDMRADLIASGIDSTIIFLDYAGFRTFDSVVRLREIFGQDSVTVISQPFHNQRAIYLAHKEGISAVGFNARDVDSRQGFRVNAREKLARVKVFVDYLVGMQPKFLGPKVAIPQ